MRPLAVVTCGPAHAPLDAVRCLTNFSTGELGAVLTEALVEQGWQVVCFRGQGATFPPPAAGQVLAFGTNASLEVGLRGLRRRDEVVAIFHAAALCDFEPSEVAPGKWDSAGEPPLIRLQPAPKLLPRLRRLFPRAWIVGWKYEVDGGRVRALARARSQVASGAADACVANGPALEGQFVVVGRAGRARAFSSKQALAKFLAAEAAKMALPAAGAHF